MRGEDAAHEAQRTDMVLYMFFLFLFLFLFFRFSCVLLGRPPFYFFFLPLTGGPSLPKPFPPCLACLSLGCSLRTRTAVCGRILLLTAFSITLFLYTHIHKPMPPPPSAH